jgi:hypothetical protein
MRKYPRSDAIETGALLWGASPVTDFHSEAVTDG